MRRNFRHLFLAFGSLFVILWALGLGTERTPFAAIILLLYAVIEGQRESGVGEPLNEEEQE